MSLNLNHNILDPTDDFVDAPRVFIFPKYLIFATFVLVSIYAGLLMYVYNLYQLKKSNKIIGVSWFILLAQSFIFLPFVGIEISHARIEYLIPLYIWNTFLWYKITLLICALFLTQIIWPKHIPLELKQKFPSKAFIILISLLICYYGIKWMLFYNMIELPKVINRWFHSPNSLMFPFYFPFFLIVFFLVKFFFYDKKTKKWFVFFKSN